MWYCIRCSSVNEAVMAVPSEAILFSNLRSRVAKRYHTIVRITQPTQRSTPMLIPALALGLNAEDVPEAADEGVDIIALLVGVVL